jgi:AcrR family transcriptional regulator
MTPRPTEIGTTGLSDLDRTDLSVLCQDEVEREREFVSISIRDKIVDTASELFYREGVHAVGVDTIIAKAGIAKSSLYRHFRTKDDLIAAYLESEDRAFWEQWNHIEEDNVDNPQATLLALLSWIGTKIANPGHRGCPQLNIVAEFPDVNHPARKIATQHKHELRKRLLLLARRLNADRPERAADQLWLLIDGCFANHDLVAGIDPVVVLTDAGMSLFDLQPVQPSAAKLRARTRR